MSQEPEKLLLPRPWARKPIAPPLILDVGSLMGSLVGQTEHNIRQALRIADAMAPCILFLDEVEKALSGVSSEH